MGTHKPIRPEATPNKGTLQSYVQNFSIEAVDAIIEILRTTRNDALKMGAAKVIIDKSIPDLKAMEIGGVDGEPIKFFINTQSGFIPAGLSFNGASTASYITRLPEVQSVDMAQKSKKDNDSDN